MMKIITSFSCDFLCIIFDYISIFNLLPLVSLKCICLLKKEKLYYDFLLLILILTLSHNLMWNITLKKWINNT